MVVHFDGWSDRFDYQAPIDNEDLHPAGFCLSTQYKLEIPKGYGKEFKWSTYLAEEKTQSVRYCIEISLHSYFYLKVSAALLSAPCNDKIIQQQNAAKLKRDAYWHPSHEHAVEDCNRRQGWTCDVCHVQSHNPRTDTRYRCTDGCDFDICDNCMLISPTFQERMPLQPPKPDQPNIPVVIVTLDGSKDALTVPLEYVRLVRQTHEESRKQAGADNLPILINLVCEMFIVADCKIINFFF